MVVKYDEKSCGCVLFRNEKVRPLFLLLHYPEGHWDLPKGHVEPRDASEIETAKRELKEETGIKDAVFFPDFRYEISYKYLKNKKPSRKLVAFFLCKTKTKDIKLSFEHGEFVWLPYEEALKKLTFKNARDLLISAFQKLQK